MIEPVRRFDNASPRRCRQRLGEAGVEKLLAQTINAAKAMKAPEVECIGKGKARRPYEFGVKVGIAVTAKKGLIVGARRLPGHPYDGDMLS